MPINQIRHVGASDHDDGLLIHQHAVIVGNGCHLNHRSMPVGGVMKLKLARPLTLSSRNHCTATSADTIP
jgi:hypothetical protein